MDSQKFWPRLPSLSGLGSFVMTEFFSLYRRSLLQHAVVCRNLFPMLLLGFHHDRVSLVVLVFFYSAYSFCRDRYFFISLTICLAKVCCSTHSMPRHRQLCCDRVSMQLLQIGFAIQFLCRDSISVLVLIATLFLVLSKFLSQSRKFVSIEFCCHLT